MSLNRMNVCVSTLEHGCIPPSESSSCTEVPTAAFFHCTADFVPQAPLLTFRPCTRHRPRSSYCLVLPFISKMTSHLKRDSSYVSNTYESTFPKRFAAYFSRSRLGPIVILPTRRRSVTSYSASCRMKDGFGATIERLDLIRRYASISDKPSTLIRYASASETERDIPAEQCTSVLPPAARAAVMKSFTLEKCRCRSVDSTSGTATRRYVQR